MTTKNVVTVRVVTAPGTNASRVGESYRYEGVTWRNSVDGCDSDGCGRVFLDCGGEETAAFVRDQMDNDDRVMKYSV